MLMALARSMKLPVWLYAIAWLCLAYFFLQILSFRVDGENNLVVSGMYLVNFGIHEASHLAVFYLPPIMVAAAGSLGEIGFTLLLLYAAVRARSYFAAAFIGLWVMLALRSVGRYIADARSQALPLVGPGETVQHDWNFILGQLGWLEADTFLGGLVAGAGVLVGVLSLTIGLVLIVAKLAKRPSDTSLVE